VTDKEATRTEQVRERLGRHLRDLGCVPVTPNRWAWAESQFPQRWRFGWMPPLTPESNVIFFCPELLAEITAALGDEDFDTYLLVIEIYLDYCLVHRDKTIEEVDRIVESELHQKAPFALELWNHTDARALDLHIVST
jgi:hypothetical protein